MLKKEAVKNTASFVVGDRKKCFRTDKLSQSVSFGKPEGVHRYAERRSLFVAKRLKFIEKSNEMRFFCFFNK